jgi:iron(II)-dependent oxidoreductase
MIDTARMLAVPQNAEPGEARALSGSALRDALVDSRANTLGRTFDLDDAQWAFGRRAGVNPVAWELTHLVWFAEFWTLRAPFLSSDDGAWQAARPALYGAPDEHFDSARLGHALRWETPMPTRSEIMRRSAEQLDATLEAVLDAHKESGDGGLYFQRLALFHEDMHAEAFAWMRASLGYPPPASLALQRLSQGGTAVIDGGDLEVGRRLTDTSFAFDNERPAMPLRIDGFEIDRVVVGAGQYLAFVEDGGYERPEFWCGDGGAWRTANARRHPAHWRRAAGPAGGLAGETGWEARWFDRWLPLDPALPMIHVNAFEAEAYCRWAGRRLPTAAEWEVAAPRLDWGHGVWEWTSSAFEPYAGFVAGPYRDYSQPWFGDHRELRGGSFATHERLHDRRYRNFFKPDRSDIFAGFRTASYIR